VEAARDATLGLPLALREKVLLMRLGKDACTIYTIFIQSISMCTGKISVKGIANKCRM
jgi:hypothetical protein